MIPGLLAGLLLSLLGSAVATVAITVLVAAPALRAAAQRWSSSPSPKAGTPPERRSP